jgi:acyl carrier protein
MASNSEVLEALTGIFRSELDAPKLNLQMDDNQDSVTGWDSLAHIRVVAALEKKFGFQFELEEIEELTSVASLVNAISSRLETA